MNGDFLYSVSIARQIPVEACESIIDSLYSHNINEQVEYSVALRCCALVCKAWRIRSQRNLFYSVVLRDIMALRRFKVVIETSPYLGDYVHEVIFVGNALHTTASPLSLFPMAFQEKLPRLRELMIQRSTQYIPREPPTPDHTDTKHLEYIPLHPRFSFFFATFSAMRALHVNGVTFPRFSDFGRMLGSMPSLQALQCKGVRWITLGSVPMCMRPQVEDIGSPSPFFLYLRKLDLVCHLQCVCCPHITHRLGGYGFENRPKASIGMQTESQEFVYFDAFFPRLQHGSAWCVHLSLTSN